MCFQFVFFLFCFENIYSILFDIEYWKQMSDTSAHAYVRSSISIQNFCLKNVCENNCYIQGWGWAGLRTALNAKDIVNLTDMGVSHIYILIIIQTPKSCAKKLDKSSIQNQSIVNLPFSSIHLNMFMKISYRFDTPMFVSCVLVMRYAWLARLDSSFTNSAWRWCWWWARERNLISLSHFTLQCHHSTTPYFIC